MKKFLKIDNATFRYRQQVLLEGISLDIKKGQHFAIVGPSGSGKSALLQALAGRLVTSEGVIHHYFASDFLREHHVVDPYFTYHDLISLVDMKHDFRNLSHTQDFYYQQRYNSWDADDAPTVEDFLREKATHRHGTSFWKPEVVMRTFDLEKLRARQLIKLSNGESKRLRMAAALLKNPRLLLLDNPLAGFDAETRKRFDLLLAKIVDSGITLIMVTSPMEIPEVATHVIVMEGGKIKSLCKRLEFRGVTGSKPLHLPPDQRIRELVGKWKAPDFDVVVEMNNVSVRYGDSVILDGINWKIKPGERWALSGPNGSGKSTLLSLINGDNPQAYANEIVLFDRLRGSGESIWELKSKIGFMSPELYQYFPVDYTCSKAVESGFYDTMGLFSNSDPKKRKIVFDWLEIFQIQHLADTKLSNVSASKQRLCLLARALVKRPPLLILDEPCQGLDGNQQEYFRGLIDKLCELIPLSLIYVTHYQEELPSAVKYTFVLPR